MKDGTEMLLKKTLSVFLVILLFAPASAIFAAGKKKVWPGIGMNKPELFNMYLGIVFPGANLELLEAIAYKSMVDARNSGIGYFRCPVSGFGSLELEIWQLWPDFFWRRFDKMLADLEENQIKIIASLAWDPLQFPFYTRDGLRALFVDSRSSSRTLLVRFVSEVVGRYKNHPAILFWELGNEWNLYVDLDIDSRIGLKGYNVSTDELLNFVREYTGLIRKIDPNRLVSNGFSMPRPAAEHLRKQPEWSPNGPGWTADSREEFRKNLTDGSRDVEIISIHFYNFCGNHSGDPNCSSRDNERFDLRGAYNVNLLDEIVRIANQLGKLVFVGEIDDDRSGDGSPTNPFSNAALERIGRLKIHFTAFWLWEGYTFPSKPDRSNIEPGFNDLLINKIKEVNHVYFNRIAPEPRMPDFLSPIIFLTAPLEGSRISYSGLEIYALASDNDRVERVEFWLENTFLGEVRKAPYTIKLSGGTYPVVGRRLRVKAKAFDSSGNFSESVVNVSGFYF